MRFRQLLPEPLEVQIEELVASLRFAEQASTERPHVLANFVAGVDGQATFQGRSGELGDDGDLAVFRALRQEVDAVLVGTATARDENYGRLVKDAAARERRAARGLAREPVACMVTRSGRVPLEIPLFAEPEARVLVFSAADSAADIETGGVAAQVQVVPLGGGEPPFTAALRYLRQHDGVRALLCEGGPTVLSALVREHVLDELFLTVSPKLTGGGDGPTLTSGGELPAPVSMTLAGLLERAGSLFLRYRLQDPVAQELALTE